jgi:cell division protein FtsZ
LNQDSEKRDSPFKSRKDLLETHTSNEELNSKNVFKLEDDHPSTTINFYPSQEVQSSRTQFETSEEIALIETSEGGFDGFNAELDEVNLFSYDEQKDPWEDAKFSFETQDPVVAPTTNTSKLIVESKAVEFNFDLSETLETKEPNFGIKTEEPLGIPAVAPTEVIAQEVEKIEMVKPVEVQTVGEFSFYNKTDDQQQKAQERRNKLKEFNSRYQSVENENLFESVPAFKRKNIEIEGYNSSEQQISSYMTEDERGRMQVKENRFLNKDVD